MALHQAQVIKHFFRGIRGPYHKLLGYSCFMGEYSKPTIIPWQSFPSWKMRFLIKNL
jgi:hypothetical protein